MRLIEINDYLCCVNTINSKKRRNLLTQTNNELYEKDRNVSRNLLLAVSDRRLGPMERRA